MYETETDNNVWTQTIPCGSKIVLRTLVGQWLDVLIWTCGPIQTWGGWGWSLWSKYWQIQQKPLWIVFLSCLISNKCKKIKHKRGQKIASTKRSTNMVTKPLHWSTSPFSSCRWIISFVTCKMNNALCLPLLLSNWLLSATFCLFVGRRGAPLAF